MLEFAGRAYRCPLTEKEKTDLLALHRALRAKGHDREESLRRVLARVLVSPTFLLRIEQAPPGKERQAVNDWELATRAVNTPSDDQPLTMNLPRSQNQLHDIGHQRIEQIMPLFRITINAHAGCSDLRIKREPAISSASFIAAVRVQLR